MPLQGCTFRGSLGPLSVSPWLHGEEADQVKGLAPDECKNKFVSLTPGTPHCIFRARSPHFLGGDIRKAAVPRAQMFYRRESVDRAERKETSQRGDTPAEKLEGCGGEAKRRSLVSPAPQELQGVANL